MDAKSSDSLNLCSLDGDWKTFSLYFEHFLSGDGVWPEKCRQSWCSMGWLCIDKVLSSESRGLTPCKTIVVPIF